MATQVNVNRDGSVLLPAGIVKSCGLDRPDAQVTVEVKAGKIVLTPTTQAGRSQRSGSLKNWWDDADKAYDISKRTRRNKSDNNEDDDDDDVVDDIIDTVFDLFGL